MLGHFKPPTHVARNLPAFDLRLDVQIACDGLHQKFQHAEFFTCDPCNMCNGLLSTESREAIRNSDMLYIANILI